ncbi:MULTISPECIES: glycosyltransferase family 2 protein [Prochlorococcus]|uniref:Putative glycosyl transferase n=1 Tax=Prochlorococcus marinus str. MIT 9116 TaxID=167544 RepID=A0A0A1ZU58_PROMR|nr:glycosyltransferase family 2 protein [Prochlorococcus marinus]KGF91717.1 putative glycosyl transferase [Prochlorococcus marinus str. MIT 9107]KGF93097.1 putative glycosyl transferase [Prochlorococcus marinus str. MIT 9116]KGF95082.1 putative glycosyl transferase [Prochlorococcus marinus str. MIT 9123]
MKPIIGIVIPCYGANGLINSVVKRIIDTTNKISNIATTKIYLINDCCPKNSWQEVDKKFNVEIIHHSRNLGVGFASKSGFYQALKDNCDAVIKIDADGQHPPEYLAEIIPFIISREENEMFLLKGSRYCFRNRFTKIPIIRRIGSLILEPIARVGLNCRGLTDIANGFIATNSLTLKYLLSVNTNTQIFSRYLFESSFLEKSCSLKCQIYQFPMAANYGKNWITSMESNKMIIPILSFWFKAICRRIFNQYLFNLNLGTLLLSIFFLAISYVIYIFFYSISPSISSGIFVSAGIAASFTSMITISSICLCLFFFYDYTSGIRIKIVNFRYYLDDILLRKDSN